MSGKHSVKKQSPHKPNRKKLKTQAPPDFKKQKNKVGKKKQQLTATNTTVKTRRRST